MYDISEGLHRQTPEILKLTLERNLDTGSPVLIFLNQLSLKATNEEIEALDELLRAVRKCDGGKIVTTARSDYLELDVRLKAWLKDVDAGFYPVKPLSTVQKGQLIDDLGNHFGIELSSGL